jgi:hypothetical protein
MTTVRSTRTRNTAQATTKGNTVTTPTATKAAPAKRSTPAQEFDFTTLKAEDSARPARTAGRTGREIPPSIRDAVVQSWARRERRSDGREIGAGKRFQGVPGSAVKEILYFLRRSATQIGSGVGVGTQVQDRQGNKVLPKDVSDRATYTVVFAAQTAKKKKGSDAS